MRGRQAPEGDQGGEKMDLVEEEFVPRLVPVQVGEVRIWKKVVTEQRTVNVLGQA